MNQRAGKQRILHVDDETMQRDTMQQGTARYGTVRSPMTEWHGSSSILSSLLSSPRRANTLYPQAYRFLYMCLYIRVEECTTMCT